MTGPRWLSPEEQRTWRAFLAAVQRVHDELDRDLLRQAGMPLAYYQVLAMLSEAPGRALRMSELAAATSSSRSRLSHAVARLEEQGWVRRESCPTDRRGAFAVLTDAGFAVLAAAAPGHVEAVRRVLFDRLDADQVDQLRRISEAVAAGPGGDQREATTGRTATWPTAQAAPTTTFPPRSRRRASSAVTGEIPAGRRSAASSREPGGRADDGAPFP